MPGCHPVRSDFSRSSAYAIESCGVLRLCQYRETLYYNLQFLILHGNGYTNVELPL